MLALQKQIQTELRLPILNIEWLIITSVFNASLQISFEQATCLSKASIACCSSMETPTFHMMHVTVDLIHSVNTMFVL